MAVTYGFFNSVNGDRKYNAEQMSEYFRGIINEGVYQHLDGGLAVTAGTGLAVNVAAGRAIIQNRWVQNSAAMSLTIADASETYARKDAVVIRLNWSSRAISIVVKTGTPAASPVAPSMTRNSTTYEMALAYVNVAANATSVTVTDKRSDSTVCGWVTVAQATSGEVDQMLNDMKTGFDGVTYASPGDAVRSCDQILQSEFESLGMQTDPTQRYVYTDGKYWNGNVGASLTVSNYAFSRKYDLVRCQKGDKFDLKSYHNGGQASYLIADSNKIVLSRADTNTDGIIEITDNNAYWLCVNNNVGADFRLSLITRNTAKINELDSSVDTLNKIVPLKMDKVFTWESITGTMSDGLYNISTKTVQLTGYSYRHIEASISQGDVYRINTTSYQNSNYAAIVILDANDNIVATPYIKTTSGDEQVNNFVFYVQWPTASKMIVNGNTSSTIERGTELNIVPEMEELIFNKNNYGDRIIDEQKKNPFEWGTFDKGCICFIFDDSLNDIDLVEDISEELGVPVCYATIPEKLGNVTTATGDNETVREVLQRGELHGNEILCHSNQSLNEDSTDAQVYKNFVTNKMMLENAGFTVNGIIEAGAGGAELTFDTHRGERYLRLYYEYSDNYGRGLNLPQFYTGRTWISNTTSANHTAADNCETNKTLVLFSTHSITSDGQSFGSITEATLRDIMTYCKTKDVYLLTFKGAYDKFRSSRFENFMDS